MAIVPRTLNIKAPYCKKVSLKHCIMKARNSLKKKNWARSGFGRKNRRDSGIAGLRGKNKRKGGI